MAREYVKHDYVGQLTVQRLNMITIAQGAILAGILACLFFALKSPPSWMVFLLGGVLPAVFLGRAASAYQRHQYIETERKRESERRSGKPVLGMPPRRDVYEEALVSARQRGKIMLDRYLVGFELDSGEPMWISDDDFCSHGCVFAKTGVGKTLWLEGLMFQQMARGRASGFTFIDAKRDPGTLADIILMALITGRAEDLVVVDPFDPVCCYNFVFTTQRPDVKARKILRCGLPPIGDDSPAKHYDRLAADAVSRLVRALESFGLAWSVKDIAVALSAFNLAYPRLRALLVERGSTEAVIELGHLASTYRTPKGGFDTGKITENLRGIASELHSISNSEAGAMFCAPRADLSLTDAIIRGKLIYYMLPRLEEAESADRMVKVFREDLEVSIGEITSNRNYRLEDPHMVIIDEGASTFGPTWANLFELARKGRFALFFGAQSVSGLMDKNMGLSEEFYQRVIANVNLKVIMRLGDNKTAEDMCEWIGKVVTTKHSFGLGVSTGVSAHELTKHIEINRSSSDTIRQAINVSDDEDDLVSAEELKHEMSAEKGLAWFDVGDGRLRKGRSIWFDSALPRTWEGREYLVKYEMVEGDEVGLAEWIDQHIYGLEKADQDKENDRQYSLSEGGASSGFADRDRGFPDKGFSDRGSSKAPARSGRPPLGSSPGDGAGVTDAPPKTGFRLNMMKSSASKIKARVSVFAKKDTDPSPVKPVAKEPLDSGSKIDGLGAQPPAAVEEGRGGAAEVEQEPSAFLRSLGHGVGVEKEESVEVDSAKTQKAAVGAISKPSEKNSSETKPSETKPSESISKSNGNGNSPDNSSSPDSGLSKSTVGKSVLGRSIPGQRLNFGAGGRSKSVDHYGNAPAAPSQKKQVESPRNSVDSVNVVEKEKYASDVTSDLGTNGFDARISGENDDFSKQNDPKSASSRHKKRRGRSTGGRAEPKQTL